MMYNTVMNIFATSKNPKECAVALDDLRMNKMILESAQILSTAMHVTGKTPGPYKITHKNHPVCIWARSSSNNFKWLVDHFYWLCSEYEYRFKKTHKCAQYYTLFRSVENEFNPSWIVEDFKNCTIYKDIEDVNLAYKKYLVYKWKNDKRPAKWTGRKKPEWNLNE